MQTFAEHYYISEKITSDLKRALSSNLLKKRKVGIDLGKGKYKIVIQSDYNTFEKIKEKIRREGIEVANIKNKEKYKEKKKNSPNLSKQLKKEFGKIFVNNVYEGEIDSGIDKIEGNELASIVYELNNGASIAFITTEDQNGMIRRYIATNTKGNDYFRSNIGTTLQQISADSKKSSNLITKTPTTNPQKEIEKILSSIDSNSNDDLESSIQDDSQEKEYGFMDISKDDFETLKKIWGTGKKGGFVKGGSYPFKDRFDRGRYLNPKTGYSGYKYYDDNDHVVYLILLDDENALIAFEGRESYEWAKQIEMLSYWKSKPGKTNIDWRYDNINNLG